jgi:hypothetical protein
VEIFRFQAGYRLLENSGNTWNNCRQAYLSVCKKNAKTKKLMFAGWEEAMMGDIQEMDVKLNLNPNTT